jgi:hypothetical protein
VAGAALSKSILNRVSTEAGEIPKAEHTMKNTHFTLENGLVWLIREPLLNVRPL